MTKIWEYIKIALKNIQSNKGRSFLTMLGIIIGISSVILIVSTGEGVKEGVSGSLDELVGGYIEFYAPNSDENGDYIELFLWKDDIFEPFSETYKLRQAKE